MQRNKDEANQTKPISEVVQMLMDKRSWIVAIVVEGRAEGEVCFCLYFSIIKDAYANVIICISLPYESYL